MASTTSYAALPYPALSDSPNVPSDMQALANRLDTVLSGLIGGGSTIPGTALNLSQVPGQITTLNNRPVVQQAYVARTAGGAFTVASDELQREHVIQTLTIPSQTYLRIMLVYSSSSWDFFNTAVNDYLRTRVMVGTSYSGANAISRGSTATFSGFFMQTVPAGTSTTLTHYIGADQTGTSSKTATLQTEADLFALMLPWFGPTFAG